MEVKAIAKGYYLGPREVGDVFEMAPNKDGKPIKGSWFVEVPQKPALRVVEDEDLA